MTISTIALLDSQGNVAVSYQYNAWGKVLAETAANNVTAEKLKAHNALKYRGYYYDVETGFYYVSSRYYDSEVGRFINADDPEILFEDQDNILENNLYTYCFNNPVNYEDSSGYAATMALRMGTSIALKGLGKSALLSIAGSITPAGWVVIGVVVVGGVVYAKSKKEKSKQEVDPYGRAGQKKQGRENKIKAEEVRILKIEIINEIRSLQNQSIIHQVVIIRNIVKKDKMLYEDKRTRRMEMHLWYLQKWKKYVDITKEGHKTGIYMRFDKNVDADVKVFCKNFVRWMRKEFSFPVKVNIYVKENYRIKAKDGELVVGTFWRPEGFGQDNMPYVRIATGDYQELIAERGKKEAMWSILGTLAHELTHYFQYVNQLELTPIGEERQATVYSDYILSDYDEYLSSQKISEIS